MVVAAVGVINGPVFWILLWPTAVSLGTDKCFHSSSSSCLFSATVVQPYRLFSDIMPTVETNQYFLHRLRV